MVPEAERSRRERGNPPVGYEIATASSGRLAMTDDG